MTTTLIALLALNTQTGSPVPHAALVKTPDGLTKIWELGQKDGKSKRDPLGFVNRFRRGIGSIRTSVVKSETVSWIWYLPPESVVYFNSFEAKKKYLPEEEVQTRLKALIPSEESTQKSLHFYGSITLMPSFGAGYGRIDRHANPNDLNGVRTVLEVGDRVIQPFEQPGDLLQRSGSETNTVAIPRYEYETTKSSATATAYGSGGYAYGTATGTSRTVRQYTTYHGEGYNWYQGEFTVEFPAFDKEGKPNIRSTDKEMTLVVIYGDSTRKATFRLDELARIR